MLRPLIITDVEREAAQQIVNYVRQPEHWYRAGDPNPILPGDHPEYVLQLQTYRSVFSWTLLPDGQLLRHLSISVPGNNYPNEFACYEIAELFGFTKRENLSKPPSSWQIDVNPEEGCIVMLEEINNDSTQTQFATS